MDTCTKNTATLPGFDVKHCPGDNLPHIKSALRLNLEIPAPFAQLKLLSEVITFIVSRQIKQLQRLLRLYFAVNSYVYDLNRWQWQLSLRCAIRRSILNRVYSQVNFQRDYKRITFISAFVYLITGFLEGLSNFSGISETFQCSFNAKLLSVCKKG